MTSPKAAAATTRRSAPKSRLKVGPALGLSAEETETVSWLVLHHLLLSAIAFKRDIDDPKTILDVADTIQSPERLRLLLVLTVADMRAVSAKVWNGWKATLLRELYARVAEVLAGGLSTTERDVRVERARHAAAALLSDWSKQDIQHFTELGYPGYWLSFDPETHARHARLVRDAEAREAPLTVDTQPLPARAVTEVTVYCADHAGLFSRISGALAVAGASIVDARIHTMTNGMALDTFWIQDAAGGAFDAPHRLARLAVLIEQALSGRIRLRAEIRKMSKVLLGRRMRAIHVPPRVVIDNHASNTYTVLEVNGRDRPGLLHDVTAAISEQGLQIASAHVTTYGVRAVDVFYVKDVFGLKVENERKLAVLRDALLQALDNPEEPRAGSAGTTQTPPRRSGSVTPAALMNDLIGGATASWRAQARHPRLLLLLSAKTWMPTSVGMTVRGIDHESELLAPGITPLHIVASRISRIGSAPLSHERHYGELGRGANRPRSRRAPPEPEVQTDPLPCVGPAMPVPERMSRHAEAAPSSRCSKKRKPATMAFRPFSSRAARLRPAWTAG